MHHSFNILQSCSLKDWFKQNLFIIRNTEKPFNNIEKVFVRYCNIYTDFFQKEPKMKEAKIDNTDFCRIVHQTFEQKFMHQKSPSK